MRDVRLLAARARLVSRKAPSCFARQTRSILGIGFWSSLLVVALALGVVLAIAASSQAADKVTVTVLAIQASPNKGPIDPQLKDIAGKLKGVVAFESLKLLSRRSQAGAYGQELTFSLPEKMELAATPLEERGGQVKTRCVLLRPEAGKVEKKTLLNSTFTAPKGEGYTIVGPALAEGRLVLVVSAE
jgi:hypothetical protein